MASFVKQLVSKVVDTLFPHGIREAEGVRIRDVVIQTLSGEYLDRYEWDIQETIEKVVGEELDALPPGVKNELADSVLEQADERITEVIRDEVRAVLAELTSSLTV
jgi:hypothetical protein